MHTGATLDIAIWSTVEQGLAITAGSLATLRPLFFIAVHKLGLSTSPSAYRPSGGYGMSAKLPGNAASVSGMKAEKLRPDIYKLSASVRTRSSDEEAITPSEGFPKSPNWFNTSAPPNSKKNAHNTENDSERSLNIKSSRNSHEENFQSGIMVSKSFYITDEERGSMMSRDGPYR
jgi:hypothetical protein